jgi:hypothetical protein
MTATPRTDAPTPMTDEFLSKIPNSTEWYVFARQLERENTRLAQTIMQRENENAALRADAERLRYALKTVFLYPDVRKYLGRELSDLADAAIKGVKHADE